MMTAILVIWTVANVAYTIYLRKARLTLTLWGRELAKQEDHVNHQQSRCQETLTELGAEARRLKEMYNATRRGQN